MIVSGRTGTTVMSPNAQQARSDSRPATRTSYRIPVTVHRSLHDEDISPPHTAEVSAPRHHPTHMSGPRHRAHVPRVGRSPVRCSAGPGGDAAGGDRHEQPLVVALVLVGVGTGGKSRTATSKTGP